MNTPESNGHMYTKLRGQENNAIHSVVLPVFLFHGASFSTRLLCHAPSCERRAGRVLDH